MKYRTKFEQLSYVEVSQAQRLWNGLMLGNAVDRKMKSCMQGDFCSAGTPRNGEHEQMKGVYALILNGGKDRVGLIMLHWEWCQARGSFYVLVQGLRR